MADAPKPDAKTPKYEAPKELEQRAAVQKFMGRPKRQPVEQAEYFYSVKKTHIVMFASSLAMLFAFLLMFRKDYVRDWKDYQDQFNAIEFEKLWYEMNEAQGKVKEKEKELQQVDVQIGAFLDLFPAMKSLKSGREGRALDVGIFGNDPDPNLAPGLRSDKWKGLVHVVVDDEKDNKWERKLAVQEKEAIRGELYDKTQLFNFAKDLQGAVRNKYETAKHHFEEAEKNADPRFAAFERHFIEMQKKWDEARAQVEERKKDMDEVVARDAFYEDFRAALEKKPIPGLWDKDRPTFEQLKKKRDEIVKKLQDLKSRFDKEKPSPPNTIRDLPMADFFGPRRKIKQVLLGDVKDQLNFIKIDKVDRCQTCHYAIDNPKYVVDVDENAAQEEDRYRFREEFQRLFVAHARDKIKEKDCKICNPENRKNAEVKEPLTKHGAWSADDAVRYTKVLMAHPRLDLFVQDSSKHPMPRFGCTICHEGDGRDTDFTRAVHTPNNYQQGQRWRNRHGTPYGEEKYNWNYRELWDLPMFPSKFAQSSCRRCHADATELDGGDKYVQGMKVFERAGCYGCHRTETYQILEKDLTNDKIDINRKTRRPGPPLERIATKVTPDWMKKWILEPRAFRATTRMPHFFQLSNCRHEVNKHPYEPYTDKGGSLRSPVDDTIVTCIQEYIWNLSETKKDPDAPASPKDPAELAKSQRRGELLVQQVGCMACHRVDSVSIDEYKKRGESRFLKEFAPTLGGIGSKVDRSWLYHWVRNPKAHFEQSAMPNLRLTEQEALDVVEYLMSLKVRPEWEAKFAPKSNPEIVDDLIREILRKQISDADVELAISGKHPFQKEKKDDKGEHPHPVYDELLTEGGKARWLGRKMVKNFGCYSCHLLKKDDTAGSAMDWQKEEGIGVELTGAQPFGSKHPDRLDFGLAEYDGFNHHGVEFKHGFTGEEIKAEVRETRHEWLEAKLHNPRVFDGGKMTSKPWDELLRMPWFDFTDQEVELLQTFVLSFTDHEPAGLVKNLVKRMSPDEIALNRGNRLVRDHNCRGCHRLSLDQMDIQWIRREGQGDKEKTVDTWETEIEGRNLGKASPEATKALLEKWKLLEPGEKFDEKTMEGFSIAWASNHRTLVKSKVINPDVQQVVRKGSRWWYLVADPDGKAREIRNYHPMDGGEIIPHVMAYKRALNKEYTAAKEKLDNRNDDLDDLIKGEKDEGKKKALKDEKAAIEKRLADEFPTDKILDPNDVGQNEARFAPMLRTQGVKTQADWLYKFLKRPYPIRPNIFPIQAGAKAMPDVNLRMPTFDLKDEEANSIVRWFAARDQYQDPMHPGDPERSDSFPNTEIPERDEALLQEHKDLHEKVLGKIILDTNVGCVKCHYVNGKAPGDPNAKGGDVYANAPDLAKVGDRIRPRWLYAWLRDPSAIYPQTTMTNYWAAIPDPQKSNEIRGAVELLMNSGKLKTAK